MPMVKREGGNRVTGPGRVNSESTASDATSLLSAVVSEKRYMLQPAEPKLKLTPLLRKWLC